MTNNLAPLLQTALEIFLIPPKAEHCPHYGGTQDLFSVDPMTVGLCTASGEVEHMGLRWAVKVCMQNRPCVFYKKAMEAENNAENENL